MGTKCFEPVIVIYVTRGKNVAEYKQMGKWKIEGLTKFKSRGSEIARVNSIKVTNPEIYFNFLRAVASGDVFGGPHTCHHLYNRGACMY